MKKSIFLIFFIFVCILCVNAQQKDIKDQYFDFLQVRLEPLSTSEAIVQGLALLNRNKELNPKQIASITYHLARLYEEEEDLEKAIPYYEKSIQLTPSYYVPYRALGFHYFDQAIDLFQKAYRIDQVKQPELYEKAFNEFKTIAIKSNAYLEKAQACDPDAETLSMIVDLYKDLKDEKALSTLNKRLALLGKNCISLLDDE